MSVPVIVATFWVMLGGCGTRFEHFFIYFPTREIFLTPAALGVPFEEVRFAAADGVSLHGWFVPAREGNGESSSPPAPTLVWFHGNGGNLSHRVENIAVLREKVRASIFIFDYRGYGLSEGSTSEEGTYRDAEGAVRYLLSRKDVDAGRLVLFGRSLGGSVAVEEALRQPPAGLILESPFTSIADMARHHYFLPLGPLLKTKYDTLSKITKIRAPVLILHGDRDAIVPLRMGKAVFQAAPEPKDFYVIKGADHNDTYVSGGEPYFLRLKTFVEHLFSDGGNPSATQDGPSGAENKR
ncbi:MAG: alpha/beta hydrolase [Nitrospinota bacterium]